MFVCLHLPPKLSPEFLHDITPRLLSLTPRIVFGGDRLLWADARGLKAGFLVKDLLETMEERGFSELKVGVAATPIAASVAALHGNAGVSTVPAGTDREFLASFPIAVLRPSAALATLLDGVGLERCGEMAKLEGEAVEVRFGAEGVQLWRLSRADDMRPIFTSVMRALPSASMDWVDYALKDPERLVFVINALLGNICKELKARGQGARELTLVFSLANRETFEHLIRPARSTSSQKAWLRLIRTHFDRITLDDAVTGIALRVESVSGELERQGDIFDRGFSTIQAAEETIAQLLDDQGSIVVTPNNSNHPLLDRRTEWVSQEPSRAVSRDTVRERSRVSGAAPRLTLQLLPEPRRVIVKTRKRRDHDLPIQYRDSDWMKITSAAGPDRVSGGQWTEAYAREYFRCVTESGSLVWLYRDARLDEWFLHGWWD
jgi:protein ImuB